MSSAYLFHFLASGLEDVNGDPLSGYKVRTYAEDSTTPKVVWDNRTKTLPTTAGKAEFSLDATGRATVFGDGFYVVKIWTATANPDTDSPYKTYDGIEARSLDGTVPVIATISDLREINPVNNQAIQTLGYYTEGDGGGGPIRIGKTGAAPGTYVDNGGSIIVPTGGDGSAAWVWEWSGTVNAKWFGARGDGVTDDTLAIQAVLNLHATVYFPTGVYAVSSIEFNKTNASYYFDNAYIQANSSSPQNAVVVLKNIRHCTFYDMKVNQDFRENYKSAIQWKSDDVGSLPPSQYNIINGMRVFNATIGLLYGDIESSQPERNVHSENTVNNFVSRGVEIPIYFNQPNGFLFMSNPIIDTTRMEWTGRPSFEEDSRCIKLVYGNLKINGGQITKTQSAQGYCVESYGQLSLNGTVIESACHIFDLGNKPNLVNWTQQQDAIFADVASLITTADKKTFEFRAGTVGNLNISNGIWRRPDASAISVVPLISHNDNAGWRVQISNGLFLNYRAVNYISNGSGGPQNSHNLLLLMSSSRLGSDAYGWVTLDSGVVERGSNENGEYILTGDGTLYCWKKNHVITVDINVASGNGFRNSVGNVACRWTPPRSFSSTLAVVFSGSTADGSDIFVKGAVISSTSDIRIQAWSGTSRVGYSLTTDVFAIGRAAQ